jgi:hypothetical protein
MAILDRRIAVISSDPGVIDAVDWFGDPLHVDETAEEVLDLVPGPDVERTVPATLNRVAASAESCVVLHAAGGVVGSSAVLLPGEPGSGKSTLVAALVERGWGYASDEAVGVGPSLEIVGYPKRLSLEIGSWPLFTGLAGLESAAHAGFDPSRVRWVDARQLHPDALAWMRAPTAPSLVLGVAPRYRAGAPLDLVRLEPLDAMTELLANDVNLPTVGAPGLETLRRIATEVPFYRMEHGGLDQAVPALHQLLVEHGLTAPS